jgi:monofunctional biosynthetic peptidoglycan transglycosylase
MRMRKIVFAASVAISVFVLWSCFYAAYIYKEVIALNDPAYSKLIAVYDWNKNEHSLWVGPKNPKYVSWRQISPYIKWAVILSEDGKFYTHHGVDYEAMKNAFKRNLEVGRYVRGGSTITQQLAKNLFLSREKTLVRKVKELIIAFIIEWKLSKTRILELYLNAVEFGPMVYGVGHAGSFYFNKHPSELNPLESALLASLLPGPKIYDPYRKLDRVEARAKRVLRKVYDAKVIGDVEYERLKESDLTIGLESRIEVRIKEIDKAGFVNRSSVGANAFFNISSRNK